MNLGAQVLVPDLVARARAEKADAVLVSQVVTQKDAHIHNTTQMSAAFREAYPAGQVPILIAGGPRFEDGSEKALGVDRIFGRGTTPGEVASYLVHEIDPSGRAATRTPLTRSGPHHGASVGLRVTHRRYVPYSHAHYAGNLVDGAYSLAAFGDVATEMCILTDGDEGLFASYSDVQFKAPVRGRRRHRDLGRDRPRRHALAGDGLRGARRRARQPGARRVRGRDARPAGRRHDRSGRRRRALTRSTSRPAPSIR